MTSLNPLVNIVQFFSEYVAQDLQATSGSVHPMLEVDSIRFLYTFRSQVPPIFPCVAATNSHEVE